MWAVQPRFEADPAAFVATAAEIGFAGIEINNSMDAGQTQALIEEARTIGLEVRSLHAPAPWTLIEGGLFAERENRTLNLAALDEAERRLAVEQHVRSLEVAGQASMSAVVVHLGGIGALDVTLAGEEWLRAAYLEAPRRADSEWHERAEAARRERAAAVGPWLEGARRSLAELAPRAAQLGVTIGLECRLRYHEFPLPEEAADLLSEHPADVAGYWHDIGHAEILARLGLVPLDAWNQLLATRLVGVHIHDVRGLTDHRAPGSVVPGGVDFAALASQLPPTALRTFEVDQHEPLAALASGLLVARAAGLVG
jgi:sugar phosphate isomerase/epimerase